MLFSRRKPLGWLKSLRATLWPRGGLKRAGLYLWHRLRRLRHRPHQVALGVAIGVFVSFSPFIGLHGPLSILLAFTLRGSAIAAFLAQVLGNPVTFPLIWFACWKAGCFLTGTEPMNIDFHNLSIWRLIGTMGSQLWPFALGGIVLGLLASLPAYGLVRVLMRPRANA